MAVNDVVVSNRQITVRDERDVTGYSNGTVQRVLSEQLHMKKVSAWWIPHLLTQDYKEQARECVEGNFLTVKVWVERAEVWKLSWTALSCSVYSI